MARYENDTIICIIRNVEYIAKLVALSFSCCFDQLKVKQIAKPAHLWMYTNFWGCCILYISQSNFFPVHYRVVYVQKYGNQEQLIFNRENKLNKFWAKSGIKLWNPNNSWFFVLNNFVKAYTDKIMFVLVVSGFV